MNDILNGVLNIVGSVDPLVRVLLAAFAMFLETSILVGLVVPGDTVVLLSSTAVSSPLEYMALLIAVVVGSLGGESLGFVLGRQFGPRLRVSWLGRKLGEKNWVRAETYLARRGGPAIFLSRFLPVLHSLIPLTVGMSRMRYRTFIGWTFPACLLWAVAYVSAGSLAAGSFRQYAQNVQWAGYAFVGVIVFFAALVVLVKRAIDRREAAHMAGSAETSETPSSGAGTQEDGVS